MDHKTELTTIYLAVLLSRQPWNRIYEGNYRTEKVARMLAQQGSTYNDLVGTINSLIMPNGEPIASHQLTTEDEKLAQTLATWLCTPIETPDDESLHLAERDENMPDVELDPMFENRYLIWLNAIHAAMTFADVAPFEYAPNPVYKFNNELSRSLNTYVDGLNPNSRLGQMSSEAYMELRQQYEILNKLWSEKDRSTPVQIAKELLIQFGTEPPFGMASRPVQH